MNPLRILSAQDLETLLDLDGLRKSQRQALEVAANGDNLPRHVVEADPDFAFGFMPALNPALQRAGFKAVTVAPGNRRHGLNPHQGLVTLLDVHTGQPQALLEGSTLTALRTAAASAAATDLLSRPDSKVLAILGTGRQAFEHVRALRRVRPIQKVILFGRIRANAEKLRTKTLENSRKESKSHSHSDDFEIQIVDTPREALRRADIVVTCTPSRETLFHSADLPAGSHLNAIGACRPGMLEVELQDRSGLRIYTDSCPASRGEMEEIRQALLKKHLSTASLKGAIGSLSKENLAGRESSTDVTIFKSVGLSIQDLCAADFFFQQAVQRQIGQVIDFSPLPEFP